MFNFLKYINYEICEYVYWFYRGYLFEEGFLFLDFNR